jgi:hypothetical protein
MKMKKTVNCSGKLEVLGQKGGHSMMDELWGGSGDVVYTSYRCENGHEYETTGTDKQCTSKMVKTDLEKKNAEVVDLLNRIAKAEGVG